MPKDLIRGHAVEVNLVELSEGPTYIISGHDAGDLHIECTQCFLPVSEFDGTSFSIPAPEVNRAADEGNLNQQYICGSIKAVAAQRTMGGPA